MFAHGLLDLRIGSGGSSGDGNGEQNDDQKRKSSHVNDSFAWRNGRLLVRHSTAGRSVETSRHCTRMEAKPQSPNDLARRLLVFSTARRGVEKRVKGIGVVLPLLATVGEHRRSEARRQMSRIILIWLTTGGGLDSPVRSAERKREARERLPGELSESPAPPRTFGSFFESIPSNIPSMKRRAKR
jgi:hypothetical protein